MYLRSSIEKLAGYARSGLRSGRLSQVDSLLQLFERAPGYDGAYHRYKVYKVRQYFQEIARNDQVHPHDVDALEGHIYKLSVSIGPDGQSLR